MTTLFVMQSCAIESVSFAIGTAMGLCVTAPFHYSIQFWTEMQSHSPECPKPEKWIWDSPPYGSTSFRHHFTSVADGEGKGEGWLKTLSNQLFYNVKCLKVFKAT